MGEKQLRYCYRGDHGMLVFYDRLMTMSELADRGISGPRYLPLVFGMLEHNCRTAKLEGYPFDFEEARKTLPEGMDPTSHEAWEVIAKALAEAYWPTKPPLDRCPQCKEPSSGLLVEVRVSVLVQADPLGWVFREPGDQRKLYLAIPDLDEESVGQDLARNGMDDYKIERIYCQNCLHDIKGVKATFGGTQEVVIPLSEWEGA